MNIFFAITFIVFRSATLVTAQAKYMRHYDAIFEPSEQLVPEFSNTELSCIAKRRSTSRSRRHVDIEVRGFSKNLQDVDVCDSSSINTECYPHNVRCSKCLTNTTYGELSMTFYNVTWEDRGTYYCSVMSNVFLTATLYVEVQPKKINCYKSTKTRYRGMTIITERKIYLLLSVISYLALRG